MASFSQLRSQIRLLESESDKFLSEYSQYAQSISGAALEDETKAVHDIEENLKRREELAAALTRAVNSEDLPSPTKSQQVQRHKEILGESRAEFQRIKRVINQERVRTNLLSSVRSDIEQHQHRSRRTPNSEGASEISDEDHLLSERNRIDNSHNMADSILAQAYETRDEFLRQRASLAGVQRRLQSTLSKVPGINTIIAKVNTRKKRDSLILASLITLCVLFLFLFR